MSVKKQAVDKGRRRILHGSALVGVGAVAVSVLPGVAASATDNSQVEPAVEEPVKEGYRLTKHIKDYYKSAAS